jgi:hypothetical protein
LYLLCYLGSFAIMAPVAVAVIAPLLFNDRGVLLYTLPLAVAYSAIVYGLTTSAAIRTLSRRESDIIAKLAPDE